MNRLLASAGALALAILVAGSTAQAEDKDDKVPAIKDVMKQHVKGGHRVKTEAAIKEKNWEDASAEVKKWVKLAEGLGKNDPPKGDTKSWKKLTGAYEKNVGAWPMRSRRKSRTRPRSR